ncbi:MAG: hypothetical protein V1702_00890 [Candidatus Woesearchaeota archaeon]
MKKAAKQVQKPRECPVCGVELDKDNKCAECGESFSNMEEEEPQN